LCHISGNHRYPVSESKKIILTTDQDLIVDGIQAIDDEFLEWFIKNNSCEEVEIEDYGTLYNFRYLILIPQEEPKQEIVGYRLKPSIGRMMVDAILKNAMPIWNDEDKSVYFIRGHVAGSLVAKMKELQVLDLWFTPIYEDKEIKSDWIKENHLEYYYKEGIMKEEPKQENCCTPIGQIKRYVDCKGCDRKPKQDLEKEMFDLEQELDIPSSMRWHNSKPKQETLEEAALRLYRKFSSDPYNPLEDVLKDEREIFIEGAEWQAERMYSDMEEYSAFVLKSYKEGLPLLLAKEWFEQFKKKGGDK
jgi:hypothetical protein